MIKAEIIHSALISDDIIMGQVKFDAKGKHHELVAELGAIITTFNDKEDYHDDLMMIINKVLEYNIDQASKELEKLKREKENK